MEWNFKRATNENAERIWKAVENAAGQSPVFMRKQVAKVAKENKRDASETIRVIKRINKSK